MRLGDLAFLPQCDADPFRGGRCIGIVFVASAVVLGLAANFGSLFLPDIHRACISPRYMLECVAYSHVILGDYTIYSIIVPSLTILVCIFMYEHSTHTGRPHPAELARFEDSNVRPFCTMRSFCS